MPPPGYQREDSGGLSSRITSSFTPPGTTKGVRSTCHEAYPYGQPPTSFPFSHTVEYDMAPSTSRYMERPRSLAGISSFLRYQPMPQLGSRPMPPYGPSVR